MTTAAMTACRRAQEFVPGAGLHLHRYAGFAADLCEEGHQIGFHRRVIQPLNRLNRRFQLTDDGIMSNAARFNYGTKHIGINYFSALLPGAN
jgi:CHASE1-domain containing sensor protein